MRIIVNILWNTTENHDALGVVVLIRSAIMEVELNKRERRENKGIDKK